jgi:hypothetical protein
MQEIRLILAGTLTLGIAIAGRTDCGEAASPSIPSLVQQRPPSAPSLATPWFVRCAAVSTKADAPARSDARKIETDLYAAIFRLSNIQVDKESLVVEAVSIPMPPFDVRDDRFLALPADLLAGLRRGISECFQLTPDRFPSRAHLVALEELQAGASHSRVDWPSFRRRFDSARMYFGFSRALVSTDARDAVVFYERDCEGTCGEGAWVWFQRVSAGYPWRLVAGATRWIS